MADKVKVHVIEIEANKLVPGAKYIFTIDPQYSHFLDDEEEA